MTFISKSNASSLATTGFPRRLGERLCLDFANTIDSRIGVQRADYLNRFDDLVRWGGFVNILSGRHLERLLDRARREPEAADDAFLRAIALREAIFRTFQHVAQGKEPEDANLSVIQREHLAALAEAHIASSGTGFTFRWAEIDDALDYVLWPIARSAVELLLDEPRDRIRQCTGPDNDCGWLFYDVSKNGTRRWCSMEGCGSQAKMRRYRARGRGLET